MTGLTGEPATDGPTTDGRAPVDGSLTDATAYKSPRVNAASRGAIKIGKQLDTSDDAARLMLITHYAGTQTVRVYDEIADTGNLHTRTDSEGTTFVTGGAAAPTAPADFSGTGDSPTLQSEGMFYLATGGTTAETLEPLGRDTATPPAHKATR